MFNKNKGSTQSRLLDNKLIERAKNTDMLTFLETQEGFSFKKAGNAWRCVEHNSLNINSDHHRWYWNSQNVGGGNAIDYLVKIKCKTFREAVMFLTNTYESDIEFKPYASAHKQTAAESIAKKQVVMPEQDHYNNGKRNYANITAYLTQARGLDIDIVNALIKSRQIYQAVSYTTFRMVGYDKSGVAYYVNTDDNDMYDDLMVEKELSAYKGAEDSYIAKGIPSNMMCEVIARNPNVKKFPLVVAVGYDENNIPSYASYRVANTGVRFRGDMVGSNKEYSFLIKGVQTTGVYVFESFIDAMSHAQLTNMKLNNSEGWKLHDRLSLSGTSDVALDAYLKRNPQIKKICLCLDNDDAGRKATNKMHSKYTQLGYTVVVSYPRNKDYNEELLEIQKAIKISMELDEREEE